MEIKGNQVRFIRISLGPTNDDPSVIFHKNGIKVPNLTVEDLKEALGVVDQLPDFTENEKSLMESNEKQRKTIENLKESLDELTKRNEHLRNISGIDVEMPIPENKKVIESESVVEKATITDDAVTAGKPIEEVGSTETKIEATPMIRVNSEGDLPEFAEQFRGKEIPVLETTDRGVRIEADGKKLVLKNKYFSK